MPTNKDVRVRLDEALKHGHAARAADFHQHSTEVSQRIASIQERLRRLPGKLAMEVQSGDMVLSFDRAGDSWVFVIRWSEEEYGDRQALLDEAPIQVKARAAVMIPELLRTMQELIKVRTNEAIEANKALRDAETILASLESEGA